MSLASLLDRLTGLAPKNFIVSAYLPALIFGFLNGVILYHYSSRFRHWSSGLTSATPKLFESAVVLIGLAVIAYLFSSVNGFLRETLEGKHFLARWDKLGKRFEAAQRAKFSQISEAYYVARDEGARISRNKRRWRDDLSDAAVQGLTSGANNYAGTTEAAAVSIRNMLEASKQAERIPFLSLVNAVQQLEGELSRNNVRVPNANGVNRLTEDRRELLRLVDYAEETWAAQELQKFNERSRFGIGNIAPTALGNIAGSMQGYGLSRYGLNLETFWTRLQPILAAGNKDFYGGLQDAKTQLDFLVACFWMSAITTGVWAPILLFSGAQWWLFLAVAGVGALAAVLCYSLAVESYVVFSELVRTSLDLYRFPLLQALHVALPGGVRDERALWSALQRLSTFGEESVDLSYRHDAKGGSA